MLGCLDMVLEQVQRNLKHDWWSDVAVVGGFVRHPMYPNAPRKSHEQILGEHEQMLLNLDVV